MSGVGEFCGQCGNARENAKDIYCRKCGTRWPASSETSASDALLRSQSAVAPNRVTPWWKGTAVIIAALLLFFPVGLFMMWRYAVWTSRAKWIVTGIVTALVVAVAINGAVNGGGKSARKGSTSDGAVVVSDSSPRSIGAARPTDTPPPTAAPKATETPRPVATATPPPWKLRVTQFECHLDSIGDRVCTGIVTNIQKNNKATDIEPVVHWTNGTDSDFGSVDINPLLPGQSSPFTVYTLHPNPLLTQYTIGFRKPFGSESEYPVEPPQQ